jgi:integrase
MTVFEKSANLPTRHSCGVLHWTADASCLPEAESSPRPSREATHEIAIEPAISTRRASRRHTIDTEEIRQQIVAWEVDGLAASTINHRLSGLSQLYAVLDGDRAHNPVAGVTRLREPQAKPDGRSPETIQRVFVALEARVRAQNPGWQTLARLKVIAPTGMRHSQVMRLARDHVYIDHDPPYVVVVDPGKDGEPHAKPLTPDGVDAFRLFVRVEAWGRFSQSSVYKSWKLAYEEAGVPFFNPDKLRHSYATALRAQGMDQVSKAKTGA